MDGTLAAGSTTINVQSTTGSPTIPFYLTLDPGSDGKREVVLVDGSKTSTEFTLSAASSRGQDGTSDVEHDSGAVVAVVPVAAHVNDLHDRVDEKVAKSGDTMTGALTLPGAPTADLHSSTKKYVDDTVDSATVRPVTDADDGALTHHEGNQVPVAATSYETVFDLAAATEIVAGSLYGLTVGYRLTIDGVTVIEEIANTIARDSDGSGFSAISVPHAKAVSSMKLEVRNNSGSSRDLGWRVVTR